MARPRTLDELADRIEIDDLLTRYATALDFNQFDLLDTVFTPDAYLSYADAGVEGNYPDVKDWLSKQRPNADVWLHLVGNRDVTIEGDAGRTVSVFIFSCVMNGETFFTGGEYRDKIVRTADGWRISERVETQMWNSGNLPDVPQV